MTTTTEAGPLVVDDLAEDEYHGSEALSSSGARKLLPPSCPARYAYDRAHPPEPSGVLNLGTAAHTLVLGKGKPLAHLDAPDWRSGKAKAWRDAVRAEGCTPLLDAEYFQVRMMAEAIKKHPLAGPLLADSGMAERSYFWEDPSYDIPRRARLDSCRQGSGRLLVVDYKTTACAEPGAFAKSVASYGYHQQAAWYLDAVAACPEEGYACRLTENAAFLFVAQEKTAPYLVTVAQLDDEALLAGDRLNSLAMEIFRDCTASGHWPGYQPDDEIAMLRLPAWARPREDYL